MKVLQIGVPKSGNFWLYQILQHIFKFSGRPTSSFIQQHPIHPLAKTWDLNYPEQADIDVIDITDLQTVYRISSIFRMPLKDLDEYLSRTNHVWTHSPFCKSSGEIFERFQKKVYIIRDPRDVLLSASRYYCSPYMLKYFPQEEHDPGIFLNKNLEQLMQQWVWHVWDHLRVQEKYDLKICFFEGFLQDFQGELSQLLSYLGIDLSEQQKTELEEAVSFSTLKKNNPKHLKKGRSGDWKERLSKEQLERIDVMAGPLIRFLNYPSEKGEFINPKNSPTADYAAIKQEIISSQKPFFEGQLPNTELSADRL